MGEATTTTTRERPILFNGPMVRAILDGRKTQTRRPLKLQPDRDIDGEPYWHVGGFRAWQFRPVSDVLRKGGALLKCPYGVPGDLLWVREAWQLLWCSHHETDCGTEYDCTLITGEVPKENDSHYGFDYRATSDLPNEGDPWRPSIHMPRWVSRITLHVEAVRVERVQDISEEDARAEGFACHDSFAVTWEETYAKRGLGWDANPWAWVVEFSRVAPRDEGSETR